jgi:hypothetical protein
MEPGGRGGEGRQKLLNQVGEWTGLGEGLGQTSSEVQVAGLPLHRVSQPRPPVFSTLLGPEGEKKWRGLEVR